MKWYSLILIFLCTMFFSNVQAQEISKAQHQFVRKFIAAVADHKEKKVIQLIQKEYRTAQIAFLGGNTEQFIDELFSGMDLLSEPEQFVTLDFDAITRIEVAEVNEMGDGQFDYVFRVRDGQHDILMNLLLTKSNKKFGFVGASG